LRHTTKLAAVAVTVALIVTGCAKKETPSAAGGSDELCADKSGAGPKIGLAYDIGGRGDKSFNDLAAAGVKKALDELDASCEESEAAQDEPDSAKEERLRTLAEAGYNPVVAAGYVYTEEVVKVAKEYPNVKFGIVDGFGEAPNVTNLVFAAEQGAFLVGVAAALKTKTKKVGFIGGVRGPIIDPFAAGYKAGVAAVDPSIPVEMKWLSDAADQKAFANTSGAKTAATALFDAGSDVVFHASGLSGGGLFDAVATKPDGIWAIGVDSDQYLSASAEAQKHILTSSLKRVDVAVFDYVKAVKDGSSKAGFDLYDIKRDGVGYATSGDFVKDIAPKIEEYKAKLVSGELKAPSKL
jgi:basic membrane protein A and related proteins